MEAGGRHISEPLGGFFMFKKKTINNVSLRPVGPNILLEILVHGKYKKIIEIPYIYKKKELGQSKMSFREQLNYLRHLINLILSSPKERTFYVFSIVGMTGIVVNLLILYSLKNVGMNIVLAASISGGLSIVWNFFLNNKFTWSYVEKRSTYNRLIKYIAFTLFGLLINLIILHIILTFTSINYLIANIIGIIVASFANYNLNRRWTWQTKSNKIKVIQVVGKSIS